MRSWSEPGLDDPYLGNGRGVRCGAVVGGTLWGGAVGSKDRASEASLQADCDRSITVIAPRSMVRHGGTRSRRAEAFDRFTERRKRLKSFSGLVLRSRRRQIGLRLQICYSSVRFRPAPLDSDVLVGGIVGFVGTASGSACSRGRSRTAATTSSPGERGYAGRSRVRGSAGLAGEFAPHLKQLERIYVRRVAVILSSEVAIVSPPSQQSHSLRTARRATTVAALFVAAALPLRAGIAQDAESPTGVVRVVPPSPAPAGFIHDGPRVLTAEAKRVLNARITAVQARTGGDIGVAIVTDLRGYAPVDAGVAIYRAWKVGKVDSLGSARRNLGALLLIVPKELAPNGRGECWISTGLGAEGTLIDANAGAICRDRVIPALRVRDYAAAVDSGIAGIAAAFDRAVADENGTRASGAALLRESTPQEKDGFPWGWLAGLGLAATGAAAGFSSWKRYQRLKPRPCPAGHGPMTRLDEAGDDAALSPAQRAEERVGSVDYDVWACASCPERLVIAYARWSRYRGCPKCQARTLSSITRTVTAATQFSTGLEETTLDCAHCGFHDVTRRITPVLPPPPPSSSSGSRSSSSGGGSSFGGSGQTAGGGGGSSY